MAIINRPSASLTLKWKDGTRSDASTRLHVPFGTAMLDIIGGGSAVSAAAAAMSDASVRGYDITFSYIDSTPAVPTLESRVERKGVFQWLLANGLTTSFSIPSPKQGILLENGFIDTTDPLVAAIVAAVITAGDFCGLDGSDIVTLSKAYEIGRASGKTQRPG